jgi:hypothetical protein
MALSAPGALTEIELSEPMEKLILLEHKAHPFQQRRALSWEVTRRRAREKLSGEQMSCDGGTNVIGVLADRLGKSQRRAIGGRLRILYSLPPDASVFVLTAIGCFQ